MTPEQIRAATSSRNVEWPTPWPLFRRYDARYHFDLDVCASTENAKCARYFTRAEDGLAQDWTGVCWMNPPYKRGVIRCWVQKAAQEVALGRALVVVALLPARTDTEWWHTWVMPHARIRFLKGRVTFEGAVGPALFPSAIATFPKRGLKHRLAQRVDPRQLDWVREAAHVGALAR